MPSEQLAEGSDKVDEPKRKVMRWRRSPQIVLKWSVGTWRPISASRSLVPHC